MSTVRTRTFPPFFNGSSSGIVRAHVEAPPQSTAIRTYSTFEVGFAAGGGVDAGVRGRRGGGVPAGVAVAARPVVDVPPGRQRGRRRRCGGERAAERLQLRALVRLRAGGDQQ